jgi:hypothetical protein
MDMAARQALLRGTIAGVNGVGLSSRTAILASRAAMPGHAASARSRLA